MGESMCGIAGIGCLNDYQVNLQKELKCLSDSITHRGPDSCGYWVDESSRIGFAHRRLAIHDLSTHGHQPMLSNTDRYVITYNGEIYNFLDLKKELLATGSSFIGGSDTEVILASIEFWGLRKALENFVGMFAFALWDKKDRKLYLARDRQGEKPLYYGWNQGCFLFGSELKALRSFSHWKGEINRDALCLLLRHNYIPAPHTIYNGIHKLIPGSYLEVRINEGENSQQLHKYWDVSSVFAHGANHPSAASIEEIETHLETLLLQSVNQQMLSDVPLGAFLSGGIDSSLIVALMQRQSQSAVKTFTIGFNESGYNEAESAKEVAKHLGTDHTELYVTSEDALNVIPNLPTYFDEPFADSSQIPTFLVSELARKKVTVVLSGDGGDELFCGYSRYFSASSQWDARRSLPLSLRRMLASSILRIPDEIIDRCTPLLKVMGKHNSPSFSERLKSKAGGYLPSSLQDFYRYDISYWTAPEAVVLGASDPECFLSEHNVFHSSLSDHQLMMCLDTGSYLPDDILVKVDRAAMANSLEGRMPLLDHRIIEFACSIPPELNVDGQNGKQLLRNILYRHVPQPLVDRPKSGFAVPIADWLRAPLREWGEELISVHRLTEEGYFDVLAVRKKWEEHVSGKNDWSFHLWGILMFQAWLDEETSN